MLAGVALASLGLVHERASPAPVVDGEVAARVGDDMVSRTALETAVGLVERDRRRPVTEEERRQILERLVDEELLFQQGLTLGIPRSDRKLRADVVSAVIEVATAEVADPSSGELRAFFETHRTLFVGPAALRMAQVFVSTAARDDAQAAAIALRARDRLRGGEDIDSVRTGLGDPAPLELPRAAVPASRLRDYVGPAAAEVGLSLDIGVVSEPLLAPDGYRVLLLLGREEAAGETFEQRQDDVLAEYQRRQHEEALRRYLDELRRTQPPALASDLGAALP